MQTRHTQSGNVLFLILIAVALFAALSYVVIQSSRSGGGNIEQEDGKLVKAQIENMTLAFANSALAKKLDTNCTTAEITSNFCPPTSMSCAWVAKPKCNIAAPNDPFAPKMRWEQSSSDWYAYVSGARRMIVWLDIASSPSSTEKYVLASFYSDIYENGYVEPATLVKDCRNNNLKNGLPTPEALSAYTPATRGTFLGSIGMKAASCFLATDASWIMWFFPIINGT